MLYFRRHGLQPLTLIVLLLLSACGGGGSGSTSSTGTSLSRIEITPNQPSLAKGTTLNLTATGIYSDNSTRTLTNDVSWQSSDDSIASISTTGEASALTAGLVTVQASLDGVSGNTELTVTNAVLSRLEITPSNAQLALGTTLDLSVLGLYSDGSSQILTQQVGWVSSDTGIFTIGSTGRVQPQSAGNTTVTASLAGISASLTVTVSGAVLTTIEISTSSSSIPLGTAQSLIALGHYSDGSLQDITEEVVWQSAPASLMTISNAGGSKGLATAVAVGSVTVTASLNSVIGTINLNTTAATLSRIDISPLNARLAAGTQSTFRATGHYSDGTIQDVSERASWATTDDSIAIISNATGERGQTLALTQGDAIVSAAIDSVVGNAALTVTAAQLLSINVTPSEVTLPVGTQQTVSAEGSFSDGSVQNLDDKVTWTSDNSNVIVVAQGQLSALELGSARISASWSGMSGHTTATVTNATLSSLQINPSNPTLAIGTETQLQAIATYSDGSQKDVTTQATWSSADDTQLRAENSAGRQGRLMALAIGDVVVTASLDGIQTGVTVSVGNATLTGLNITAASTSLDSAQKLQLTALGNFSDGSSQDLTSEVIWSSDAPNLADISNNAADRGQVIAGIGVSGSAVITASFGGFNPTLTLNINDTPQRPISLVVLATPNAILNDGIDASSVEIRVQAASPGAIIADGTVIDLQIIQAGTPLSSQSLVTTAGTASASFTTTDTGILQIKATVDGTTISNSTALYASSSITDVIIGDAFADVVISGTQILNGARFGFLIHNLSNRNFPLTRYELRNGTNILVSTNEPLELNNNVLTGGLRLGIIVTLNIGDFTDQGIEARYYLTDPSTGAPFFFRVIFTTP